MLTQLLFENASINLFVNYGIPKPKIPSSSSLEMTTFTFNPSPFLDSTHPEVMVRNQ
jgi:hypothetical protein